jgi:hypothetical protein
LPLYTGHLFLKKRARPKSFYHISVPLIYLLPKGLAGTDLR